MGKIDYSAIYNKNKHGWFDMTEEPEKYEALLSGHYSDSNHFIYELLQNAEDEQATKVVFEYYDDKLIFYHNGLPIYLCKACLTKRNKVDNIYVKEALHMRCL